MSHYYVIKSTGVLMTGAIPNKRDAVEKAKEYSIQYGEIFYIVQAVTRVLPPASIPVVEHLISGEK